MAAPRLRDAYLTPVRLRGAYTEMVCIVRTLYQKCRLVHADLSEYNILYHEASHMGIAYCKLPPTKAWLSVLHRTPCVH